MGFIFRIWDFGFGIYFQKHLATKSRKKNAKYVTHFIFNLFPGGLGNGNQSVHVKIYKHAESTNVLPLFCAVKQIEFLNIENVLN